MMVKGCLGRDADNVKLNRYKSQQLTSKKRPAHQPYMACKCAELTLICREWFRALLRRSFKITSADYTCLVLCDIKYREKDCRAHSTSASH